MVKSRFELMEENLRKLRESGEKIVGEPLDPAEHKVRKEKKTRYARRGMNNGLFLF